LAVPFQDFTWHRFRLTLSLKTKTSYPLYITVTQPLNNTARHISFCHKFQIINNHIGVGAEHCHVTLNGRVPIYKCLFIYIRHPHEFGGTKAMPILFLFVVCFNIHPIKRPVETVCTVRLHQVYLCDPMVKKSVIGTFLLLRFRKSVLSLSLMLNR